MTNNKIIPYGRQTIENDDIESVVSVLKDAFLTQGPLIGKFEEELCNYTSAKNSVAVSSATAALHLSCLALGLEKDDLVWTSPNSFVASANCALYCGAQVDFVDIDPETYNMCPHKLEEKLKSSKKLPKIVIPVHFSGQSCDMKKIWQLSKKYNFRIIEDASHAIGASYNNKKVGNCEFSDICVFSFHPVKIITTGEGGSIMTNDNSIAKKVKLLSSHGVTRDPQSLNSETNYKYYYEQIDLGFNYRITDIQCALGISQLSKIDSFIKKRHQIAESYNNLLKDSGFILPYQSENQTSSYHLYVIRTKNRDKLYQYLQDNNISVNVHYIPIHTQPYYQKLGFNWGDFPIAENYYKTAITLPIFPTLTESEVEYVTSKLLDVSKNEK